jgi:hypothetical protein
LIKDYKKLIKWLTKRFQPQANQVIKQSKCGQNRICVGWSDKHNKLSYTLNGSIINFSLQHNSDIKYTKNIDLQLDECSLRKLKSQPFRV